MKRLFCLFCLLGVASATGVVGAVSLEEATTEAGPRWVMENDLVRVEIDPARGGRVSQFRDKRFEHGLIREPINQGLFSDLLADQRWPGELAERAYEVAPGERGGDEVSLTLSTVFRGEYRNAEFPESRGVRIEKTYRMAEGEPGVRVEHVLSNPTDEPKKFSLWIQNAMRVGADPRRSVCLRPARAGVYRFVFPEQPKGEAWSRYTDSIAPWTAAVDPETGHTLVFFQDWDFLAAHYTAGKAFTVEWFMAPLALPPGKSWSTRSRVVSFQGGVDLAGVSPAAWLGMSLTEDEKGIAFRADAVGGELPLTVKGTLHGLRPPEDFPVDLALEAGAKTWKLPKGCAPPLFIDAIASPAQGESFRVAEFLGGENFPKNEPLPGYPPLHEVDIPERKPEFPRPDAIALAPGAGRRALVAHGAMTGPRNLESALAAAGYETTSTYEVWTSKEESWGSFPAMHEEMLRYGLIVLNNADGRLLSAAQRAILADWLEAGGRLLILGGTAWTKSNWERNPFAEWLPFSPGTDFGATLETLPMRKAAAEDDVLAAGLPKRARVVFWDAPSELRRVQTDEGALIVTGAAGAARIVACGLTSMGAVEPSDYWQSDEWKALIGSLISMTEETE